MNLINMCKKYNILTYSFSKWISLFFIMVSILLFCYTYYKAEFTFKGTKIEIYSKYYIFTTIGILFWIIIFHLREKIRSKIVTSVVFFVIGLYMVEGAVILLGLGNLNRAAAASAAKLGVDYDSRTKLEVIDDLIRKGVDAVPTVHPSWMIPIFRTNNTSTSHLLPLGGVSNRKTVYNNESGKYMIYMSDRYGFNNPDIQWDSSKLKWLLLGDSYTHGSAVQPGEDITSQIRLMNQSDAISLGIGGNGPLMEYASLVEYGKSLAPEKVLWMYFEGNDLRHDLKREKKDSILIKYMRDGYSQNLTNRQKEIDKYLNEYIEKAKINEKEKTLAFDFRWIRLYAIRSLIGFDEVNTSFKGDDPLFKEILIKAKERVNEWGGELYFVYLPSRVRYNLNEISHEKYMNKSDVINTVKRLKIPVIDIHKDVFADHRDPLSLFPFRIHGHYNKEGYSEIAKAIMNNIDNNTIK